MKTRIFACALSLVLGFGLTARATNIVWTNAISGNWNATTNWSPNQVPASTDNAFITNSGTYSVTFNASATVASFTLGGASGTQTFLLNANTLTLSGASTVGNNGAFNLGGGTLSGAGAFTINGSFSWTGGTINTSGGVTLNGASSFSGVGNGSLSLQGLLINAGQVTWSGSGNNLYFGGGTLTNLAAGTITITTDVSPSVSFGNDLFGNAGVLIKNGTSGTTTLGVPFVNTGTLALQTGTLNLTTTSTQSGLITNSSGTTLQFSLGTHAVTAGFSATGAGSVIISGGTVNFNSVAGSSLPNLTLSGGSLSGTGSVAINGSFSWTGGTINTSGGVTLNGASSFSGVGNGSLSLQGLLINAGQVTWSGSGNNLYFGGGTLTNLAAGTITITTDVSPSVSFGNDLFGNAGVLIKNGTSGTTTLGVPFVNTGTLALQTGTLNLTTTSTQSGLITNSSGTTLQFSLGTHAVTAGFSATGAGSVIISGGTVNFNSVAGSSLPNLTLSGGSLSGTGSVAINGSFSWTGGTINTSGGVTLNGASSFSGVGNGSLSLQGLLINAGQVTWSGSGNNLYFGGGTLTNLAAGTITITTDVSPSVSFGNDLFGNAGVLIKNGTSGTTTLGVPFVNTGTLALQTGTLNLTTTSTQSGLITNSSGTTLQFSLGTHAVTAGFSATGAGSVIISGGTVNFNSVAGSSLPNLTLSGGSLSGTGSVAINGSFSWTGGTINTSGGVTLNGASSFSGVGNGSLSLQGLLINAGQVTWSGSGNNLYLGGNSILTNQAAGTITITADVGVANNGGTYLIGNAGVLIKNGTSGTTTFGVPLVNTGTLAVQSGTISLNDGGTQSGLITNSSGATLNFSQSTYSVTSGFSATGLGSFVINGATVNFNSGTGSSLPNLSLSNGILSGTGLVAINGPFTWTGGTINNNAGVTLNGASSFSGMGNGAMSLQGLLINAGQATWSGSNNNLYLSSGTLTNLAAGAITITADVSAANNGGINKIGNAGVLSKTGASGTTTLGVPFVNTGTVSAQSGLLSLTGGYNLTNGTLNFGISGVTNFGAISLSGAAGLTGGLSANLNGGYIPNSTNLFPVLSYGSKTGFFSSTNLPFADAWQVNYSSTNLVLQVLNARPVLTAPTNQSVNELTLLTANSSAVDLDTPAQTLTFSLVSPPTGMTINPATGAITWTPAQTESPATNTILVSVTDNGTPALSATNSFTIVVVEINVAPALPAITSQTVNELAQLSVNNAATNANIHATNTGYALINPPTGMTINSAGLITWTPSQTQSPTNITVTTVVTNLDSYDLVNPILTSTNSFTVVVLEINVAPSLPVIPQTTVNELALLSVNDAATNANIHATITGYGLINPPVGMTISPASLITWTPSQTQSPSTNTITAVVTNLDAFDLVNPVLTSTNSFTVIVFAPTLSPLGNSTVNVGQTVSFTAAAADNDSTRTLTFSLGTAPASASINSASGLFNWRPPVSSAGASNNIQVKVTANSTPSITVTQSFSVLVNALTAVTLTPVSRPPASFQIQMSGPIGPDYILQATGSLTNTTWLNLLTNTPGASPFTMTDPNPIASTNLFYRVLLGP